MKLSLAALLSLFFLPVANAQAANRHKVFDIPCQALKRLPFVDETLEARELESLGVDGILVHRQSHKLAEEQIVFLEPCDPKEEKPIVEERNYARYASVVRDFTSYAFNGRVFAYRFTCYVVKTRNGFITTRAGATGDVYYIDETGNGTFDRYRGAMPLRFLPDWLK